MGGIYQPSVVVWLGASETVALQAVEMLWFKFTEYQT